MTARLLIGYYNVFQTHVGKVKVAVSQSRFPSYLGNPTAR